MLDLEAIVLKRMDKGEVDGVFTAKFFNSHAKWAHFVVRDVVEEQNQPMRVYHEFWDYHDKLYERVATTMVERWEDVNFR